MTRGMKENTLIKIGDVVQLKSGGPEMTVTGTSTVASTEGAIPWITCMWFDEVHLHNGQFAAASVTKRSDR